MTDRNEFVLATYIEAASNLPNVIRLTESLKTFGGHFHDTPVRVYRPDHIAIEDEDSLSKLRSLGVQMATCTVPEDSRRFCYAGKVYAAGEAEAYADRQGAVLIWMDEDTIVLSEPGYFDLAGDISLAYVPVMHNRSGSLYDSPPDDFWSRIYDLLNINADMLFPMITPADQQTIRAYFHCGLLITRPRCGILRRWVKDFELLYKDSVLSAMCEADHTKNVFLHQTALTGSVLNSIRRNQMRQLPESYNYPIFFEKQYGAVTPFDSIENVVTLRCVVSMTNVGDDWPSQIKRASG